MKVEVTPNDGSRVSQPGCAVPQSGNESLVGPGRMPGHAVPQSGEERLVGPDRRTLGSGARLTNDELP